MTNIHKAIDLLADVISVQYKVGHNLAHTVANYESELIEMNEGNFTFKIFPYGKNKQPVLHTVFVPHQQ